MRLKRAEGKHAWEKGNKSGKRTWYSGISWGHGYGSEEGTWNGQGAFLGSVVGGCGTRLDKIGRLECP